MCLASFAKCEEITAHTHTNTQKLHKLFSQIWSHAFILRWVNYSIIQNWLWTSHIIETVKLNEIMQWVGKFEDTFTDTSSRTYSPEGYRCLRLLKMSSHSNAASLLSTRAMVSRTNSVLKISSVDWNWENLLKYVHTSRSWIKFHIQTLKQYKDLN